jgi:hypothetical protein
MVEWLGYIISDWPVGLVIAAGGILLIIAAVVMFYVSLAEGYVSGTLGKPMDIPTLRRKKQ